MTSALSLRELQRAFSRSVFEDDPAGIAPWIEPNGLAVEQRLQVYRNMVFNTLIGALKISYPTVLALVGEDCFDGLAARHVVGRPSGSGNLQDYGAVFADFLAAQAETAAVPYLADVARLDWARQQAYLAADAAPILSGQLAGLSGEALAGMVFTLHPSVHRVDSRYPILDIWRFCQETGREGLQLAEAGQNVLVWRSGDRIAMQHLLPGGLELLAGLAAGLPLGRAIEAAGRQERDSDLAAHLSLLLQNGLVVDAQPGPHDGRRQ